MKKLHHYEIQNNVLREELEETKKTWKEKQGQENSEVTVEDIASVVSSWTGIPVSKLAQTETDKLLNLEDNSS